MTVWLLQLAIPPQEEAGIPARAHLPLPYENLPDLSGVDSQARAMQLLRALHPDMPPESLSRKMEAFWSIHSGLREEDVIVVPLPASARLAVAQVSGRYEYRVGEGGSDIHLIPVTWPVAPVPLSRMRKFQAALSRPGMSELADRELRIAILGLLPHSYNRFHKWRWLLGAFMVMGVARMLMGMLNQQ